LRFAERRVNEESLKRAKYARYYKTITITAKPCTMRDLNVASGKLELARRADFRPPHSGLLLPFAFAHLAANCFSCDLFSLLSRKPLGVC
jgi:hypothetical protein